MIFIFDPVLHVNYVIDPEARQLLLSCDDRVTHYTVMADRRSR